MLNLFQHNKLPPCVILKQVQDDDQGSAVITHQQHPHSDRRAHRRQSLPANAASSDRICGWWFC
jgi:hypothetical protein